MARAWNHRSQCRRVVAPTGDPIVNISQHGWPMEQAWLSAKVERAPTQLAQHTVVRRSSDLLCAEVSDLPLISPMAWVIRSSTRFPWPSHTRPITRYIGTGTYTWRAYRFPRWPPVVLSYSQVEVLKHAPGTTSRVFPACNAWQNALTLTASSSALSIPPAPFWSSLWHFHRQCALIISGRYGTSRFRWSAMHFASREPYTARSIMWRHA